MTELEVKNFYQLKSKYRGREKTTKKKREKESKWVSKKLINRIKKGAKKM